MMTLLALQRITHAVGVIEPGQEFRTPDDDGAALIAAGQAALPDARLIWNELPWTGATVVCIASGPSLTWEDCEHVHAWRTAGADRRVIVVNNTYQLCPWADVLYACDERWWNTYHARARADFAGQLWTQDVESHAGRKYGLHVVHNVDKHGLSRIPGVIHQGSNGGYQAVNLAYIAGARLIVLLGFDMATLNDRMHWHDDHPAELRTFPVFERWITAFNVLAADLEKAGVPVINATRVTALRCFPCVPLQDALR